MRIGIDARCLQRGLGGGTARVLYSLLKEWSRCGQANEYILYFDDLKSSLFDLSGLGPEFICREVRWPKILRRLPMSGIVWQQLSLLARLLRDRVDIFYSPYYSMPLFYPGKKCVVVHDISYHTLRQEYPRKEMISDLLSRLSCSLATLIITDSEASKKEIVDHYHVPAGKIAVIPCGIDKPANMLGESRSPEAISGRYALYVGTMFNRRHVVELIRAWDARLAQDKKVRLVLVGRNATRPRADLVAMIDEINRRHGGQYVIHHEFVNDEELNTLYAGCSVFIYLSTYEGFGLPPLEAMLHDKPVIVGNADVFKEVIGQASLMVDPKQQKEILEAVGRALNEPGLASSMVAQGRQVVEKLSWVRAARLYLERFYEIV
ncbi:MAG: glycosyltransferase family 4 protein [Candidatus Saganbacteria bacterium]|nr:glycosyltransferase family 4 protein [Candidatus Saganbacteria bacterium]